MPWNASRATPRLPYAEYASVSASRMQERRRDEARARDEGAAPAAAVVADEDGELDRGRARQHVDEREPFEKALAS